MALNLGNLRGFFVFRHILANNPILLGGRRFVAAFDGIVTPQLWERSLEEIAD